MKRTLFASVLFLGTLPFSALADSDAHDRDSNQNIPNRSVQGRTMNIAEANLVVGAQWLTVSPYQERYDFGLLKQKETVHASDRQELEGLVEDFRAAAQARHAAEIAACQAHGLLPQDSALRFPRIVFVRDLDEIRVNRIGARLAAGAEKTAGILGSCISNVFSFLTHWNTEPEYDMGCTQPKEGRDINDYLISMAGKPYQTFVDPEDPTSNTVFVRTEPQAIQAAMQEVLTESTPMCSRQAVAHATERLEPKAPEFLTPAPAAPGPESVTILDSPSAACSSGSLRD